MEEWCVLCVDSEKAVDEERLRFCCGAFGVSVELRGVVKERKWEAMLLHSTIEVPRRVKRYRSIGNGWSGM